VAGTAEYVTALQLDTKIDGLPADVLAQALNQAYNARLQILDVMNQAISEPRSEVREGAPKIVSFEIPLDKIGEVIGPKGKVINTIQQETGADVNIDDENGVGIVTIGAKMSAAVNDARSRIDAILNPPRAQVGDVYSGKVVNITKFGAFVNILPGRDGLLHISKLGKGKRVERVEDVVQLGSEITVRVDDIDPQGKVALSPVGDDSPPAPGGGGNGNKADLSPAPATPPAPSEAEDSSEDASDREYVSFEDSFDREARQAFGDLGPATDSPTGARPGEGDGGGPRRNRDRRRRR
jgi:polyribonucleotide nucleotidyltransferase